MWHFTAATEQTVWAASVILIILSLFITSALYWDVCLCKYFLTGSWDFVELGFLCLLILCLSPRFVYSGVLLSTHAALLQWGPAAQLVTHSCLGSHHFATLSLCLCLFILCWFYLILLFEIISHARCEYTVGKMWAGLLCISLTKEKRTIFVTWCLAGGLAGKRLPSSPS